jgi:hypothetical protein
MAISKPLILYACAGGTIVLPQPDLVLVDREDGGNLVINPPRAVWERGELDAGELTAWSHLVGATGTAMLRTLPQLDGGCINYWEAGNWALNEAANPPGPKTAPAFRSVHLHLLGRSRFARSPDWAWGEAPRFPEFSNRFAWAAGNRRLSAAECVAVVDQTRTLLVERYAMEAPPMRICPSCGYPSAGDHRCEERGGE